MTQVDRITYDLGVVAKLEESMTQTMPKSWVEDMMFLKANNVCAPTGLAPKRATKEIQLHYGTNDSDEWRSSRQRSSESLGGLLRKLGDANFDSVKEKIRTMCETNTEEHLQIVADTLYEIVSKNEASHDVMIRFVSYLRAANPSFGHPVCPALKDNRMTPVYGIWSHKCFQNRILSQTSYETNCEEMMKTYESFDKDSKHAWAPVFEFALQHHVLDAWWKPRLQVVIDNPNTPLPLCFKIEDYFDN